MIVAINSGSIHRANKFVDAIVQRLSVLAHSPKGDYIVHYRQNKRWVIISRIIHGSRDQDTAY